MRGRLFWIVLLAIAFALLVAIGRQSGNTLSSGDVGYFAYYLILLVFVGSSLVVLFRRQLAQALKAAAIWVAIGLALIVGYSYRSGLNDVYQRVMAELVPGRAINRAPRTVEIVRGRSGDFQLTAHVNGVRIPMVLDTGATSVVLTEQAAKAAGLPIQVLVYDVDVDTANGRTRAAAVTLDRIGVGNVEERSVPALVAQRGQLRTSLLGLSFLNRLESWEVRGDKIVMRGFP